MSDLILRSFNNKSIRQRADGWVSLTDMATAGNKKFAHWNELKSTKEFLEYAEGVIGIPITEVKQGGTDQGTWGHPKVAIKFAAWVSIPFEFQVVSWIEELLTTGSVNIGSEPKSEPFVLKPAIERIESLHQSLAFFGIDPENPRFKQGLQDIVGDVLGLSSTALPSTAEKWCGVAERAEQLGHPVGLITKHRSQLGKAVKAQIGESDRKMEDRLCNGSQRPICVYRISEALDAAIESFFVIKAVA